MKETSPKSNNGTIVDNNEIFNIEFDPISDALAAIRNGECIIVVDDERRENEGDLICAAQFATPQQINFMATEGRGLICLACLLYTSPSPRDGLLSRMPSSA